MWKTCNLFCIQTCQRPAVIDPDNNALLVFQICDPNLCTEGERPVCGGEVIHVEHLAVRGLPAVIVVCVVGGNALERQEYFPRGIMGGPCFLGSC